MLKLDNRGTRMFSPEGVGTAGPDPVRVDPSKTIDPDGTGNFQNPAGDGRRKEAFADWNLDPEMPGEPGEAPAPEPKLGKPASQTLDQVVGEPNPALNENPEGDRPPLTDPTKQKAEERPPEAPDTEAAAGDEGGEVPDQAETDIAGIIAKYETTEQLAKGYKHVQQAFTKKGEELKTAQTELAQAVELRDRFLERGDNGDYRIKTDAAVAQLQHGTPPPAQIDQAQIMAQAAADYRKYLSETLELADEDIDDAMQRSEPAIKERAQQIFVQRQSEIKHYDDMQKRKAAASVNNFFTSNPKYLESEEVKAEMNAWYDRFPERLRTQLILHEFLPLRAVAEAAHQKVNFKKAIREAYEKGRAAAHESIEPTTGSAPTPGQRAPASRGAAQDPDAEIKAGIVGAGVLDSIFDEL